MIIWNMMLCLGHVFITGFIRSNGVDVLSRADYSILCLD